MQLNPSFSLYNPSAAYVQIEELSNREENTVVIKKNSVSLLNNLTNKIMNFIFAVFFTSVLITKYTGISAFHDLLKDKYRSLPKGRVKFVKLSFLAPSRHSICKTVVAIGNPVILKACRKIPRQEISDPKFFESHPDYPLISGGRPFNSVLEAIGMGILVSDHEIHQPFIKEIISALNMGNIRESKRSQDNLFELNFKKNTIEQTAYLMEEINSSIIHDHFLSIDFRFFSLKIFLSSFYPNSRFCDDPQWIRNFSEKIEEVSSLAFESMLNPYTNTDKLRAQALEKLDPYINELMEETLCFLSQDYKEKCNEKTIKQIMISLLFAGGDNIKKYLDHIFVELGNKQREKEWLNKENLSEEDIKDFIKEVGRLYPVIYAQSGLALENFTIHYQNETIEVHAGDELHYTTWEANKDENEWGEEAHHFNPSIHKKDYSRLNAEGAFGGYPRNCKGKAITLVLIQYVVEEFLKKYRAQAYVQNDKKQWLQNYHPTELNFNQGIKEKIQYRFRAVSNVKL